MIRFIFPAVLALLVSFAQSTASCAQERRLALIIANSNYAFPIGKLNNPAKDAVVLRAALERVGFAKDDIKVVTDATRDQIVSETRSYARRLGQLGPKAIGFFYYSGHGASNPASGQNYLLPVDVLGETASSIWKSSTSLETLLAELKTAAPSAAQFAIFDACRDHLLTIPKSGGALSSGSTGEFSKGFQPIGARPSMLIAYATAYGEVAADGAPEDTAGPYALAIAENIIRPGLESVEMFRRVQIIMNRTIGQRPVFEFETLPPVYFGGGAFKLQAQGQVVDDNKPLEGVTAELGRAAVNVKIRTFHTRRQGSVDLFGASLVWLNSDQRTFYWIVAQDKSGITWPQTRGEIGNVGKEPPARKSIPFDRVSEYPLNIYVVAVDKEQHDIIKSNLRLGVYNFEEAEHPVKYRVVSNVCTILKPTKNERDPAQICE